MKKMFQQTVEFAVKSSNVHIFQCAALGVIGGYT